MKNRTGLIVGWLLLFASPVAGQEGTATRTSLGDPVSLPLGVPPRYWENTGWSNSNFSQERWGVEYGTELNNGDPWTVVLQEGRTNAALTAGANKLTFDLNGRQYNIHQYRYKIGNERFLGGGLLSVYDGSQSGAYLRVINGTLDVGPFSTATINVGDQGFSGEFRVEHARVKTSQLQVGAAANSPGEVILGNHGVLEGTRIFVGRAADGVITLNSAGSQLIGGKYVIGNRATGASGTVIVNHPDALVRSGLTNLLIHNPAPAQLDENLGLIINAGRVEVGNDLVLGVSHSNYYGAVAVNGGTLRIEDRIFFASSSLAGGITGGKLFLHGGELNVPVPHKFNPAQQEEFYWDAGMIRYRAADVTLNESQIVALTQQGAETYRGDRQAGSIATGQVLASDGAMIFSGGDIGLKGGTISPTGTLTVNANLLGYGTINAEVIGTGTITNNSDYELAIGALGGMNPLRGTGLFRVGHLEQSTTYGGMATGSGGFYKVGDGTQTMTGTLENSGGVFIEDGMLTFEGALASLSASRMVIANDGTLELLAGSSGTIDGMLANAGRVTVAEGGSLTVDGGFANDGWLMNNGLVEGNVSGVGRVSGTGSFTGTVDILGGSVLAPGNSPGTLEFKNLTLDGEGQVEFEIAAATGIEGIDWDLASVSGLLSWAGTSTNPYVIVVKSLNALDSPGALSDFDPSQAYSWRFIEALIGNPNPWNSDRFVIDATGFETGAAQLPGHFFVTAQSDGLYLNYGPQPASMPEPNSLLLVLGLVPFWYSAKRWQPNKTPGHS